MASPNTDSLGDSCSAHTSWWCLQCDGTPEITVNVSWEVCRCCLTSSSKAPAASNKLPISGRNGMPSRYSYAIPGALGLNPRQYADPCKFSREERPRVNNLVTGLCNTGTADLSSAVAAAPGRAGKQRGRCQQDPSCTPGTLRPARSRALKWLSSGHRSGEGEKAQPARLPVRGLAASVCPSLGGCSPAQRRHSRLSRARGMLGRAGTAPGQRRRGRRRRRGAGGPWPWAAGHDDRLQRGAAQRAGGAGVHLPGLVHGCGAEPGPLSEPACAGRSGRPRRGCRGSRGGSERRGGGGCSGYWFAFPGRGKQRAWWPLWPGPWALPLPRLAPWHSSQPGVGNPVPSAGGMLFGEALEKMRP